jgi:PhoPQ-activated pathogenicity-related protein
MYTSPDKGGFVKRRFWFGLLLLVGITGLSQPPAELFDYVHEARGTAVWEVVGTQDVGAGRITEIRLRSQVWRGVPWNHVLFVCEPGNVLVQDVMVVYIAGGEGRADALLGLTMASFAGLRVAVLGGVPDQPLFGLREDALIAHTFERYLQEGDSDWPLLLPMVQSAHAAMDALEALAPELWGTELRGFVVTGASKRGWTTYLVAATAPERVLGMAPIVFDFLNIPAQLGQQDEFLGGPSPMLSDYTALGLTAEFTATPEGARLAWIVDPYSYRNAYTMPKLVVVGSNDPYWTVGATSLYWPGLPDPKLLLVVPNAGHGVLDVGRVMGSLSLFARLVAQGEEPPRVESVVRLTPEGATVTVHADWVPVEARLWVAESATPDFRQARWAEQGLPVTAGGWEARVLAAGTGYTAFFAEFVFESDGLKLYVSSPTRVLGP